MRARDRQVPDGNDDAAALRARSAPELEEVEVLTPRLRAGWSCRAAARWRRIRSRSRASARCDRCCRGRRRRRLVDRDRIGGRGRDRIGAGWSHAAPRPGEIVGATGRSGYRLAAHDHLGRGRIDRARRRAAAEQSVFGRLRRVSSTAAPVRRADALPASQAVPRPAAVSPRAWVQPEPRSARCGSKAPA